MTVWTEKRFIEELKAKGLTKDSLEEKLVTMLTAQSLKISTAESCRGRGAKYLWCGIAANGGANGKRGKGACKQ